MRSLNLDQLRALIEVVELGSFSAAARRLNLSQPAVSLQVRELENRYGLKLVERLGKHAHATAPGLALVEQARRIAEECNAADLAMRRFRDGWLGRVRIGTTLTAMMYELPPILKRLHVEHPGIELLVSNMPTRDSVEKVIDNMLDFALVTLPVKSRLLRITTLRPEMLVAILPATTPNIPDEVTPGYVATQPLILEFARGAVNALVTQWLSRVRLSQAPMPIGIVEAVKKGVASGLGMSIVPDVAMIEPVADIVVRPLKPPVPCTLALIEHRNKPDGPALKIVREALLELRSHDFDKS
jgi:DNA-binding transcriptional LysR family regulator